MSQMCKLIKELPSTPMIVTEELPETPEDITRLLDISSSAESGIAAFTTGIAAIGNVLSQEATSIPDEDIVNLGWLLSSLASAVDGLRYIETQADSILTRYKQANGGEL